MAYYYSPFRKTYDSAEVPECPFCSEEQMKAQSIRAADGALRENEHYRWVVNTFPKFEGHTMLVPKRHLVRLADESPEEVLARQALLVEVIPILAEKFPDCGIEYFLQTGRGSAASIAHLHWHLLPALPEDNLRSFEKLGHFYTTEQDQEKIVIFPQQIRMSPEELQTFLIHPTTPENEQ